MSNADSAAIRDVIFQYFQLAKTKEIEKIELFIDPEFTKFGDSPPYDRRDHERALMLEQLQFASISDYDFKLEGMKVQVFGDCALASFSLEVTGMIVDDYSFRGTTISNKSRATILLRRNKEGRWKMVHQHLSKASG